VACFWLLALAPAWTNVAYTFSDLLYVEQIGAPAELMLRRFAVDLRERHPAALRVPDPARAPNRADVEALGIKPADAQHVVDAIGVGADVLLTNDRPLRRRAGALQYRAGLRVRRPSEFLVEAVLAGFPWTTRAPWPWDVLDEA
jgi:hypothetical protein